MTEVRWSLPSAERLNELLAASLPLGLRAGPTQRTFHRDLYFDTPDGDLRRRGASCRLRFHVDDRRALLLEVAGVARWESRVVELEPRRIFFGDTEPARRLRAIVSPGRLMLQVELEIERRLRPARLPVVPAPQFMLAYDTVAGRDGGEGPSCEFHELVAWRRPWGVIPTARIALAIEQRYGVSRSSADRAEHASALRLPPAPAGAGGAPRARQTAVPAERRGRVGSPVLRDAVTLSALAVAARSELVPEWSAAPLVEDSAADRGTTDETDRLTLSELRVPALPAKTLDAAHPAPDQFINRLLSTLEFNARVLPLAEDPATPLLTRLRFLTIFSTNLDQFFIVDVGAVKHQAATGIVERSPDGLTPAEQLDAIAIRLRPLVARQYRCFRAVAQALAAEGTRIRGWGELAPHERAPLDRRVHEYLAPVLTPKALTRAPGHPLPHLADP